MEKAIHKNWGKKGWIVTFAGLGVNLALGVLYSWGVFAAALRESGWSATQTQIPYMMACAIFALLMVPGGRFQDQKGPKSALLIAAIITGIGFVMSGFFMTVFGLTVFFGIFFGTAMGYGYAATTPAALKWFGPEKRGLISGIVVSGFGLAGIYVAPLTAFLIGRLSLESAFFFLGIGYCLIILILRMLIDNPPEGFQPVPSNKLLNKSSVTQTIKDYDWKAMMKTPQFYSLWMMFFFGTFAGLLVLGQLSNIGQEQGGLNASMATMLVMLYAVFNWLGRIVCGSLSDKFGRKGTLLLIFGIQIVCFSIFVYLVSFATLAVGTALVAFAFGGMLTIFPATVADYYGVQNLGLNYGLVFTAWGGGGVFGPLLGGLVRDMTGAYHVSYIVSAALCVLGVLLTVMTKKPQDAPLPETHVSVSTQGGMDS